MEKLKLNVIKLSNEDVIATSTAVLFNTLDYRSSSKWFFYNVDLTIADNSDTSKIINKYDGSPYWYGVDSSLFDTYESIAEGIAASGIYHYINGKWIKCSEYCGETGINHSSHIS